MTPQLRILLIALAHLVLIMGAPAYAERFELEGSNDSLVGSIRYVKVRDDETLIDIAREFDIGYDQIVKANPGVNRWIPGEGTKVVIPQMYILPSAARKGLVLNIPELRLYYYPPAKKGEIPQVMTYPVSIGRMDWRTPLGTTKVVAKERDPVWRPPASIRAEHERDGEPLPEAIPGGDPTNPLGRFALRLGIPSYLIHGVDERKAFGIGMRVTHGCIRMYPEDIEPLFSLVSVNTPVLLLDEPIKIGRFNDRVFLSVHQPLEEGEDDAAPPAPRVSVEQTFREIRNRLGPYVMIDQSQVASITEEGNGIPQEIAQISPVDISTPRRELQPTGKPKTINEEYNEALSQYLTPRPTPSRPADQELDRRAPLSAEDDDDAVRRYLQERY
jgi:L,D-transpeptidase ErfK/SrfK